MVSFEIIFYIFSLLSCLSSFMVIFSVNPVISVFYLVLVFILVGSIILMLSVEFIGIVFIIVYVGAVAVLFLFIVMMLNIRVVEKIYSSIRYLPLGFLMAILLFVQILGVIKNDIVLLNGFETYSYINWVQKLNYSLNIEIFGSVMFNYYFYDFIIAGMVLLVGMIGAIVLTINHKIEVLRQEVYKQVGRSNSVFLYKSK